MTSVSRGLVMRSREPTRGKRGEIGRFVTLRSGRVIFIRKGGYPAPHCGRKGKMGGSLPRSACAGGGGAAAPRVTRKWSEDVDRGIEDAFSKSEGLRESFESPEEYKKWATGLARDLVETSKGMAVNVPLDALDDIAEDGRLKNAFDEDIEQGTIDRHSEYMATRRGLDDRMFGISENASAADRPIYGYLLPPDASMGEVAEIGYGEAFIHLKKDVEERATVTFGDSLDECGGGEMRPNLSPSPLTSPDYQSFNVFSDSNNPLDEPETVGYLTYAETQIFGGVALSDIDYVSVPEGTDPEFLVGMEEAGIEIDYY